MIQPHDGRRKKLLLADMDSTMIAQECIDELADFVGFKARVAAITERAMRGEIAFEPALRERVALLKGLPAAVIDEVIPERIKLMPGGRAGGDHAGERRVHLCGFRRLHCFYDKHRGGNRLRRTSRQRASHRRDRKTDRPRDGADRRPRGQVRHADRASRAFAS